MAQFDINHDYTEDELRKIECLELIEYHKYWIIPKVDKNPKFDEFCRALLDIKDATAYNHDSSVNMFARFIIEDVLPRLVTKTEPIVIAVVPSHEKGKKSAGMSAIVRQIADQYNVTNKGNPLIRHTTVSKNATGGSRDMEKHLNSIHVKMDLSFDKVILFDDVRTTGNSLRACKKLLEDAGADLVIPIAFGQTTE